VKIGGQRGQRDVDDRAVDEGEARAEDGGGERRARMGSGIQAAACTALGRRHFERVPELREVPLMERHHPAFMLRVAAGLVALR
jgi:hypothetical protein